MRTFAIIALATFALLSAACAGNGDTAESPGAADGTAANGTGNGAGDGDANGAGGAGGSTTEIAVELVDMDVLPETSTAPAGTVDFVAENTGALPHELIVVRTDLAEEDLPMDGGVVDVSQLDILGETDEFATGEGGTLTVTLEAGDYVLFCNVAGHYASGMHTPFTVE